ncbi:MAG: N-6 DNA methylase [Acidobacteriota bacterium]
MLAGVSGDLLSHAFSEHVLPASFAGRLGEDDRAAARRLLLSWWRQHGRRLGPASSVRDLFDRGAAPVLETLGYRPVLGAVLAGPPRAVALLHHGSVRASVIVFPWGVPMAGTAAEIVRQSVASGASWGVAFNGSSIRLLDLRRAYARRYIEFDIDMALDHPRSFNLFWACLRATALETHLGSMVAASVQHGVGVCVDLRSGVLEGVEWLMSAMVGRRLFRVPPGPVASHLTSAYEQAITIAYRILFLLFAESRGLLPGWHPIYRDAYSVAALRALAERPGTHSGLWDTLRALTRLAHAGCHAGDLHVTAFNGRLFEPSLTPLAERSAVDDGMIGRAIVTLTTRPGRLGRERIAFGDLGVEQLGAVYESVLDYEPVPCSPPRPPEGSARSRQPVVRLIGTGTRRKASGTFYTPAAITEHLVRETLAPLVEGASPETIVALRVVDPAMGSGAFLVAACRYLADAYERALVRDTGRMASDITEQERAAYRRLVAQRCLYGVDVNPMAVQVARLSLWLTTLAADQPLTFLDHHVVAGDSLAGASLDDIARQRPGPSRSAWPRPDTLPFEPAAVGPALKHVLPVRERLASQPDDTASVVRDKEMALRLLNGREAPLAPLVRLADTWCAWWFWDDAALPRLGAGEYGELLRAARGAVTSLHDRFVGPRLAAIDRIARARRFFHWTLAFPEVFYDTSGEPLPEGGFDAVVGNPPWEMIRGDAGPQVTRTRARHLGRQLTGFARESGVYRASGRGHLNLYQLFVERALRLARRGGRVGLVVPWGLVSDHGSADLRRYLFEQCSTEELVGFENTTGIFPVHRGVRFVLLTASPGRPTRSVRCRFGVRDVGQLERTQAAGAGDNDTAVASVMTPSLLVALSGPRLAVPWVRSRQDLKLLECLSSRFPRLSDESGWRARFGRELNVTDDAHLFEPRSGSDDQRDAAGFQRGRRRRKLPAGAPVVEGFQIEPFRVDCSASRFRLRSGAAIGRDVAASMRRWRLGYRDVASATNRLTVIAAVIPPGAVTVHTVFCLKTILPLEDQWSLCALLNSFVANYLARLWVTTHVTTDIVERLPAPGRSRTCRGLRELARLAVRLGRHPDDAGVAARLQARVGRMYGLAHGEFAHVLGSFPLVDAADRRRVLEAFDNDRSGV